METSRPDRPEAKRLREKILAGSQDIQDYRALAGILMESGEEEETLALLEKALDLPLPDVEQAALSADVALFLYEFGREDRAITVAQAALSQVAGRGDSADVLMIRGLSHAVLAHSLYASDRTSSDRQARLALQAFEHLMSRFPDSEEFAEACRYAGWVCGLTGEHAKAVNLYKTSLQVEPAGKNKLACLVWLANALRCQESYTEAEERLREALRMVVADKRMLPRIYFELGKIQRLTDRPEEALITFEQVLAKLEQNPSLRSDRDFISEIKWELGYLYSGAKRYGEAILNFREVLGRLPDQGYPYCNVLVSLGTCYLAVGQYAGARDCYREVLACERASQEERHVAEEGLSRLPPVSGPRTH
jgi:tetratricopeptide (TPR) repeat protein